MEELDLISSRVTINYLALGDSYTIGEGVAPDQRFPSQIIDSLEHQKNVNGNVEIIATTGWRTDQLISAIQKADLKDKKYEFITLLIGVNNQFQGKSVSVYEKQLDSLINISIEILEGRKDNLILISIPDYGVTPFAANRNPDKIAEEINLYNEIKKKYAEKYDIPFVYITDLTRKAKEDISLLASDQLHPSGKLYAGWVERLLPEIYKILNL